MMSMVCRSNIELRRAIPRSLTEVTWLRWAIERVVRTDGRPAPLFLELTFRHIPELPEDGLLFSGMMVVSTQTSILREGHPVSVSHSACGPSSGDDLRRYRE